jgi:hypothetical protein
VENVRDSSQEAYDPRGGADPNQSQDPPRYEPIEAGKFIALNLATFSIYGLVWLYRDWRYIKERDQSNIWPFFRGVVFGPLWYFMLLKDLREHENASVSAVWAFGYLVLGVATARLPDPYWLLGLLSFIMLLPPVSAINGINRRSGLPSRPSGHWRGRSIAMTAVGAPIVALSVLAAFGPSTSVVDGPQVSGRQVQFLRDIGILEPDDEVLFFYSPGFISATGEGTALTERGVGAYWTDIESGERSVEFALFQEIENIDVDPSTSWIVDTYVTLTLADGTQLSFLLSAERDRDDAFVEEMERRWRGARSAGPFAD